MASCSRCDLESHQSEGQCASGLGTQGTGLLHWMKSTQTQMFSARSCGQRQPFRVQLNTCLSIAQDFVKFPKQCYPNPCSYYIHFSDKFSVSLGNVTCREFPLEAGSSLRLPPTLSTNKMLSESWPWEESEVSDTRKVLSEVVSAWVRPMPGTPGSKFLPPRLLSLRSGRYRRVWDVLLISLSSRERKEREWLDMAEDVLRLSEQCCVDPSLPDPPMRQKRHLIFSMALLSTVFRRRM